MTDMIITFYLCQTCRSTVRAPGGLQRSWCPECQDYNGTVSVTHIRVREQR